MSSDDLRAQLFGRFALTRLDDQPVGPWGRPAARRLTQLLCLRADRRIGREEVAEALFPRLAPARAANAVAKALSMARAAIGVTGTSGRPILQADRIAIWVDETVRLGTDLDDAREALDGALRMPPGTRRDVALASALAPTSVLLADEPYADWAHAARAALDVSRDQARLALARDRSAGHGRADPASRIAAWGAVAASDPTVEEAAVALMREHAAAGRRDRAIRVYLQCVAALRDELGVAPSPELDAARMAVLAVRDQRSVRPSDWSRDRRLVGRDQILRRLRRLLAPTRSGRGPAIVLEGPAGIGKSHLLGAVAAELQVSGWRPMLGRAVPDDQRAPYASLRQALGSIDRGGASPGVLRLLGIPDGGHVGPPDAAPPADPEALAEELGMLLDVIAALEPVALVLDDVQWADTAMLGILGRLAARPGPRRWALLLGARNDEPARAPVDLGTVVRRVELPALGERATAAAVRAALAEEGIRPPAGRLRGAVERSAGNPFFAIELARMGPEQGREAHIPDAIVQLLRRRIEALSAGSRTMLSIAAVASADASYQLVLDVNARLGDGRAGLSASMAGMDELFASGLVVDAADGLALGHPLVRDAVVTLTNPVRRGFLHARIADAILDLEAPAPTSIEAAALHRLSAFEAARLHELARPAAEAGFDAGARARHAHAASVAADLLLGALGAFGYLRGPDRQALAGAASRAWLTLGHIRLDEENDVGAETAYRHAQDLAASDAELATISSALAGIPYRHGRLGEADALYREGLAGLRGDDPAARARLESDLAWVTGRQGKVQEALTTMDRVAPVLLRLSDAATRCRTADRMGLVLAWNGRTDAALEWLQRGIDDATANDVGRELMVLLMHRGGILAGIDRFDAAQADLDRAAPIADQAHDRYLRSLIHAQAARLNDRRGRPRQALAQREAEALLLTAIGNSRHLAQSFVHRAQLLQRMGRTRAATEATVAATVVLRRVEDPEFVIEMRRQIRELDAGSPGDGDGVVA
jgi:DNA-binding SARP family transcriptional activator/tetratricopeptide (TPR) repeat protein